MERARLVLVRAARTYVQVFIGLVLAGWSDVIDVSLLRTAAIAAIPAALAVLQNGLEGRGVRLGPRG